MDVKHLQGYCSRYKSRDWQVFIAVYQLLLIRYTTPTRVHLSPNSLNKTKTNKMTGRTAQLQFNSSIEVGQILRT